jgi:paraquat-inducible protein A
MSLGGRRFLLVLAVVAASLCLALGVSLPFVRLTRFMLYTYEHSLIAAVDVLTRSGQFLLGIAVLVFAIFLPVLRLLYLLLLVLLPLRDIDRLARQLYALEWLGKWSLYDVLALASTIVLVQSQSAYEAGSAGGIYGFTGAVLLMLLAHAWLRGDVAASRMRVSATKLAYSSTMRGAAFNLLFLLAAGLLVLGVMLPAIRFSGSYAGTDQHSAASLLLALYGRGEHFPCLVLFTLAILLPGMKLVYLLTLIAARMLPYAVRVKSIPAIEWLGGYSIAEIMLLALMLFHLGASDRAGVSILPGAYCFAASALLTMAAFAWANALGPAAARHATLAARLAGVATPQR